MRSNAEVEKLSSVRRMDGLFIGTGEKEYVGTNTRVG